MTNLMIETGLAMNPHNVLWLFALLFVWVVAISERDVLELSAVLIGSVIVVGALLIMFRKVL